MKRVALLACAAACVWGISAPAMATYSTITVSIAGVGSSNPGGGRFDFYGDYAFVIDSNDPSRTDECVQPVCLYDSGLFLRGGGNFQTLDIGIYLKPGSAPAGLWSDFEFANKTGSFFDYSLNDGQHYSFASGGVIALNTVFSDDLPEIGLGFHTLAQGAVPEPAAWAMMLAGFGAIGGAMRRRHISKRPLGKSHAGQ